MAEDPKPKDEQEPAATEGADEASGVTNRTTTVVTREEQLLRDFPSKAPGVYRWAVAAVGFMAAVSTIAATLKPENIVTITCTTIFIILLIFLLFSFEKTEIETASQSKLLSWFSVLLLMAASSAIVTSVFFAWPLAFSATSKLESAKIKANVDSFDFRDSILVRDKNDRAMWRQIFGSETTDVYNFVERRHNKDYLLLWDSSRKIHVRIPAAGGLVQWTEETNLDECTKKPCWLDLQGADVKLRPAAWFFSN
ncbi:hypothetical protein [Xanthobacter autotrophicus]|uniref:hypothetical protein n=1 Tax=Xanthobacter autotrophicus TaxID=280 RepID=UPI00372976D0